jgi:hypothetical protein
MRPDRLTTCQSERKSVVSRRPIVLGMSVNVDMSVIWFSANVLHIDMVSAYRCITLFIACFTYFGSQTRLMRSPCSLRVSESFHINFWMPQPVFMKLGTYIMAPEPISRAYFINASHPSVCLYLYPPIVARQRLCKNVIAAAITHATIEELFDTSFSMRPVSYQRK